MRQLIYTTGTISFFFLLLFIYTKLAGPISFSVNTVSTQKTDTFNVNGKGKVIIKPDIAVVNTGVDIKSPTVQGAQDQMNGVINKVASEIKKLGVEDKDIKTVNFNISPTYDYQGGSRRITGYQASTTLSIKIRQIDKVNSVIDTATANGANQVGNISFDVDDRTKAESEARQKAVDDAKEKAQAAAKAANFQLGRIVNYSENYGASPRLFTLESRSMGSTVSPNSTEIEPGSSEININVTLSYEIR